MLPHLRVYIEKVMNNPPDTKNFSGIEHFLKDSTLEAKLHFSAMIAEELEEFLGFIPEKLPSASIFT